MAPVLNIRRQDPGYTAKETVRIDMGGNPGILLHVQKRFCVGITGVWQDSGKGVGFARSNCLFPPGVFIHVPASFITHDYYIINNGKSPALLSFFDSLKAADFYVKSAALSFVIE